MPCARGREKSVAPAAEAASSDTGTSKTFELLSSQIRKLAWLSFRPVGPVIGCLPYHWHKENHSAAIAWDSSNIYKLARAAISSRPSPGRRVTIHAWSISSTIPYYTHSPLELRLSHHERAQPHSRRRLSCVANLVVGFITHQPPVSTSRTLDPPIFLTCSIRQVRCTCDKPSTREDPAVPILGPRFANLFHTPR
jgi:hypothetical protein